jgi:hypothetical protein
MKNFSMEDLKRLMEIEDEVCISMYMPSEPKAATTDEQRIRFKNLLQRAEKAVQASASRKDGLEESLRAAQSLRGNDYFWRHQSDGLAAFLAPGVFLFYRLPIRFEEAFSVGRRFVIKPLLPMFMADGRFYLLALSQAEIRLFVCTRESVSEIDLVDVPDGIDASLKYDNKQSQLQFHSGTAGGGTRPAMFHGHGVGIDDNKDEILRYFQKVDRGLSNVLADRQAPLVLAGVDYLLPIFRQATSHPRVLEEAVVGNPESFSGRELHAKALEIVRPELERAQREAAQRYRDLAGKGFTAAGVREVVPAAAYGRVETLFVIVDERRPGTFEPDKNEVTVSENGEARGEDLLDLASLEALKNGGRVFAVPKEAMPEARASVAAILRY